MPWKVLGKGGVIMTDNATLATKADAARYLGISPSIVTRAVTAGHLTPNADGTFDRDAVDKWGATLDKRVRCNDNRDAIQAAELDYRQARAEKERLIADQLKGILVNRNTVEKQFASRAEELQRNLMVLSRRIAAQLAGKCQKTLVEVVETIDREVNLLLASYTRQLDGITTDVKGNLRVRTSGAVKKGVAPIG